MARYPQRKHARGGLGAALAAASVALFPGSQEALAEQAFQRSVEPPAARPIVARTRSGPSDAILVLDREELAVWIDANTALLDELRRPSTLVISGGVSLGSYQAGFLHFYTEYLLAWRDFVRTRLPLAAILARHLQDRGGFRIATGASAGSINAFLAAVAGCQKPRADPEESLFFNTWIPVGIAELSAKPYPDERSLFTRAPIDAAIARIEDLWTQAPARAGWAEGRCSAFLGMTVTRLRGREVSLAGGRSAFDGKVGINRQSEKFLLALEGEGRSRAPRFRPFVPVWDSTAPEASPYSLYPVLGDDAYQVKLPTVMKLLRASSGFPVAFEPETLSYSFWRDHDPPRLEEGRLVSGSLGPVEKADFVDGGVFDNTPLLLAQRMDEWSRAAGKAGLPPRTLFLEPDAIGWQKWQRPTSERDEKERSIFGVYLPFLGEFIRTARGAELQHSIENNPAMADSLSIPPRMMPVASGQVLNFLGFFEKSFRVFDFYMGMVDAWDYLRANSLEYRILERHVGQDAVGVSSTAFACFREHRRRTSQGQVVDPRLLPQCADLARDRTPSADACEREAARHPRLPGPRPRPCVPSFDEVRGSNLLALLETSAALKAWTRGALYHPDREDTVFFRTLGERGFRFVDLPAMVAKPVDAGNAEEVIREVVQERMHHLGTRQPKWWQELPTSMVTKAGANYLRYQVPTLTFGVGLVTNRGLELGVGLRLGYSRFILGAGVRWQPLESDLADAGTRSYRLSMVTSPFASLTREWYARPEVQVHGGAGWTAPIRSHWSSPVDAILARHGPQLHLGLTIFQRFYITGFGTYFLDDCATNPGCSNLDTAAPLQTRAWDGAVTLGFRFTVP